MRPPYQGPGPPSRFEQKLFTLGLIVVLVFAVIGALRLGLWIWVHLSWR
jgi:hypothetical protein